MDFFLKQKLIKTKMDYLKILIDTLEPLSGPSWLFKFGCNFLIIKASVDKRSL